MVVARRAYGMAQALHMREFMRLVCHGCTRIERQKLVRAQNSHSHNRACRCAATLSFTVWSAVHAALLATLCGGCLPVITPPLDAQFSVGPAQSVPSRGGVGVDQVTNLRLGIAPGALLPPMMHRTVDASAGFMVQQQRQAASASEPDAPSNGAAVSANLPGAYLAVDLFPWSTTLGDTTLRARSRVSADMLFGDRATGGGATIGVGLELVRFALLTPVADQDAGDEKHFFGLAWGEAGVGLLLNGGWHQLSHADPVWSLTAGLTFRLPTVLGVICCYLPGDGDE